MSEEFKTGQHILSGYEWVVFGPDWGRHPSVSQHLFSEFLGFSPVLWVETVGLREPQLSKRDLIRSIQKIVDFISGRRRRFASAPNGLTVICPPTLPFTRIRLVRLLNAWLVRRGVEMARRRLNLKNPTLVVCTPSQSDFVGSMGEGASIYYCSDQYSLWPGMNQQHVVQMERSLLKRVDAIVAVSDYLAAQFKECGKPVCTLKQGVDPAHFSRSLPVQPTGHFEIVYFGMIDERLDLDLIADIARKLPQAIIRLIGPAKVDLSKIAGLPSIHVESAIPYEDLPKSLVTTNLFILPFLMTELARSCSPLKIKEYLACERPVISMPLPEAEMLSEFVHVAKDQAAFLNAVVEAKEGRLSFDAGATRRFIQTETWRAKAVEFCKFVRDVCAQKRLPTNSFVLPRDGG